jgi:hypothetical protein
MATKKTDAPKKRTVSKLKQQAYTPKPAKVKFNAGTWLTVLIFIGLIGAAVYLNRQKDRAAAEATPASGTTYLFSASVDGSPTSIEISPSEADAQPVKLARNEKNVWALELPQKAEAVQSSAEAAATQVTALEILSQIDGNPSIFGLAPPSNVITLVFANGNKHTLEIGDSTPTSNGYYVRLDKDKMMIVDLSGIDSLLQLAAAPPYVPTPTAEVTVTPTP